MAFPTLQNQPLPNFPKPLDRKESIDSYTFPSDLVNGDKRNFYTYIGITDYNITQQFNNGLNNLGIGDFFRSFNVPRGIIKLPIPVKLDDNLVLNWGQISLTDAALSAAGSLAPALKLAADFGGVAIGQALNPLMFLQFQRPDYRTFSLSWAMTPRNEKESVAIKKIITKCKQAASPKNNGFTLGYPQVLNIKMYPDDIFGHMVFKPCIINSVQVSYSGAPNPSFLNSKSKQGAPTVVTLTLNISEMQFWYRDEIT